MLHSLFNLPCTAHMTCVQNLKFLVLKFQNYIYDGIHEVHIEEQVFINLHRWIPRFGKASDASTKKLMYYSCGCNFFDQPTTIEAATTHVTVCGSTNVYPFSIDQYQFASRIAYLGDFISVWVTEHVDLPTYKYSCNACHDTVLSLERTHHHIATGKCYIGAYLLQLSYFAYNTRCTPVGFLLNEPYDGQLSNILQWKVNGERKYSCLCVRKIEHMREAPGRNHHCLIYQAEYLAWFGAKKFTKSINLYFPLNIPRPLIDKYLRPKAPTESTIVIKAGSTTMTNVDVYAAIKLRSSLQCLPNSCCPICGIVVYRKQAYAWTSCHYDIHTPVPAYKDYPSVAHLIQGVDERGYILRSVSGILRTIKTCTMCKRTPGRATQQHSTPCRLPQPSPVPTILNHTNVRQKRMLSMVNIHYGRYQRSGDIVHARIEGDGHIERYNVSPGDQDFSGMVSVMHYGRTVDEASPDEAIVQKALRTLRSGNLLLDSFTSTLENLVAHPDFDTPTIQFNATRAGNDPAMIVGMINDSNQVRTDRLYRAIGFATTRTDSERTKVFCGHRLFEPLAFPHLYPRGTYGYDKEIDSTFTLSKMIKARILSADSRWKEDMSWIFLHVDQYLKDRIMGCQRFTTSNALRGQINAGQLKQSARSIVNAIHKDVPGSAEHLYAKQLDIDCVIRKRGAPHIFVTFSCDYEMSYMRMVSNRNDIDIACAEYVIKWFGVKNVLTAAFESDGPKFGKFDYCTTRSETQDRSGRFHSHSLLRLFQPQHFKSWTTAHFPNLEDLSTPENQYLHSLVEQKMVHNCLPFRCSRHGACKYGYPKGPVQETYYDELQQRYHVERSTESSRVVEYSPFLLLAFGVHLNVELVAKDGMHRYLTKYQTKPIATVSCTDNSNSAMVNYLRARVLQFPQVIAVAMGFSILTQHGVAVDELRLCAPSNLICAVRNDYTALADSDTNVLHATQYDKYASRPLVFESMTMPHFFATTAYIMATQRVPRYVSENPIRFPSGRHIRASRGCNGTSYRKQEASLVRFKVHSPLEKVNFFAMVYYYYIPNRGHLLDFERHNVDNFKALCYAKGLLNEDTLAPIVVYKRILLAEGFSEEYCTKKVQRVLFVNFFQSTVLYAPYIIAAERLDHSRQLSSVRALSSMDQVNHFIMETLMHYYIDIGLNESQLQAFEIIIRKITQFPDVPHIFIIQGCPGTGKSFLLKALIRFFQNERLRLVSSSTTNITAALLHPSANTIHSNYRIVPASNSKRCISVMTPFHPQAAVISGLQVAICDEFSFIGKSLLDGMCVSHSKCQLASIQSHGGVLGNTVYIFTGDAAQLPSTEYNGLATSEFWNQEKVTQVAIPITLRSYVRASCTRLQQLIEYFYLPEAARTAQTIEPMIETLEQCICNDLNCSRVPDGVQDYGIVTKKALRDTLNNRYATKYLPRTTIYSSTSILIDTGANIPSTSRKMARLNKEFGIPESVQLVPGMVLLLVKTISKRKGLKNGVRLKLVSMHPHHIVATIIGDSSSTQHTILFVSEVVHLNDEKYERIGLPVLPAYFSTTHKLQGATCPRYLYIHITASTARELSNEYFAPQLFLVQISRVKQLDKIHIHWPQYNRLLGVKLLNMRDAAAHHWIQDHNSRASDLAETESTSFSNLLTE